MILRKTGFHFALCDLDINDIHLAGDILARQWMISRNQQLYPSGYGVTQKVPSWLTVKTGVFMNLDCINLAIPPIASCL